MVHSKYRVCSLVLAILMVLTVVGAPLTLYAEDGVQAEEPAANEWLLVADYDMSFADGRLTDRSGNGHDAPTVGITEADFSDEDGAAVLHLGGDKEKYARLPAGVVTDDNYVIEATFKADGGADHWLFALGQGEGTWNDNNVGNYVFVNPLQGNGTLRSGIKQGDRNSERLLPGTVSLAAGTYYTMRLVSQPGKLELYIDGALVSELSHSYTMASILPAGDTIGYIARSLYTLDPGFNGSIKSFRIYGKEPVSLDDAGKVAEAKEALALPYGSDGYSVVRGNITLPAVGANDTAISWATSHPEIVSTEASENPDYDATPAGVVTRPAQDTQVTMTATITYGDAVDTKDFTFTVKAAVAPVAETDLGGYFFTYFSGESYSDGEQVFFAASQDGLNWTDLNDNKPVLTSSLGDKGVRDPFIIRSPEGDKFYMIATDLRIANGAGWSAAQTAGSQSLMVWESTDLVNWSDQRMVKVARNDAGCTWAPEAHYDARTGEYIVYWASKIGEDGYSKHRVYYAKTRDFYTFTEPEVMMEGDTSLIDTTIIENDGSYYRLTKVEGQGWVYQDKVTQLLHSQPEVISAPVLEAQRGVEGPTSFKFIGEDKWCVLLDNYGGIGYYPLVCADLENGVYEKLESGFHMPSRARHGTPIPVTTEEYEAVMAKWGPEAVTPDKDITGRVAYFPLTEDANDASGNGYDGAAVGDVTFGEEGMTLPGGSNSSTNYVSLPGEIFKGRDELTISVWLNANTNAGNYSALFFGTEANSSNVPENYWLFNPSNPSGLFKSVFTNSRSPSAPWGTEVGVAGPSTSANKGQWVNYTTVITADSITGYINGELAGTAAKARTTKDFGNEIEAYIGRSNYLADHTYAGTFKDLDIYADALSADQVKDLYNGITPSYHDMLAWYTFEDAGATVTDASGNGNDATVKGNGAAMANGMLTLPGGAANSGAGYVEMPTGMFDGQDTLTISAWVKNETGAGNYAALYFGRPLENGGSYPAQYWLFNPSNPSGLFKSVVTNSVSAGSPWATEYGISPTNAAQGINGPATSNDWAYYTTVIEADGISAYYNGQFVGKVATTRTVSDFGSDLVAFIGRSPYADMFFQGSVRDLKIYAEALTAQDVYADYYAGAGEDAILAALEADRDALSLPSITVEDLELAASGANGSQISWATSDAAVIAGSGAVIRPAEGQGAATVTLTATLTIQGVSLTRDFEVMVPALGEAGDLEAIMRGFDLGISYITGPITLHSAVGEATVTWNADPAIITPQGAVTRPAVGAGDQAVTLTAAFTLGEATATKAFEVTVAETDYGNILTYNTGTGEREATLHLAAGTMGDYEALNSGKAVRYPTLGARRITHPMAMRAPDGGFVLMSTDNSNSDSVLVYDSADLIDYTNERLVKLNDSGIKVARAFGRYDNGILAYRVLWYGDDGKCYETITDFESIISFAQTGAFTIPDVEPAFEGALQASEIGLTQAEYEAVVNKFSRITNTSVQQFEDIELDADDTLELPDRIETYYNDGSSKYMPVEWNQQDITGVGAEGDGAYTVRGTITQVEYGDPFIEQRADPHVTLGSDGYYYFTASYPMVYSWDADGYDRIILRRARTIEGLADAEEIVIWDESNTTNSFRYVWAPEIHEINGVWYVFFTTSQAANNVWGIRPIVLACTGGDGDPYNPANWETEGHYSEAVEGDSVAFRNFSLDMTYFEVNGTHYVAWAEKPGYSNIMIASIDPAQPWKLTSKSVLLSTPEYAWEWSSNNYINEGPAVIQNNGKVYMAFSAASVDETYCVGTLTANADADLLDANSWAKSAYPVLATDDLIDQNGPGHNSFTVDSFGNPVIVYHARTPGERLGPGDGGLFDPGRHARVKPVHFTADGGIAFNMTPEEELNPEYREISITVKVSGSQQSVPVSGVGLNKLMTDLTVGDSELLRATIMPANATDQRLTWHSSNEGVATVNENGEVTAMAPGTADITVTTVDGGKTATCKVTVRQQGSIVETIKITAASPLPQVRRGRTMQLAVTVTPEGAAADVIWTSSNPSVLTVDATGKVAGVKAGLVMVTATTANGKSAAIMVRVTA